MANKIYLVKEKDIHRIDGKSHLFYMDAQKVIVEKDKIKEIFYFDKEESQLKSSEIDTFWRNRKEGDTRFTFLQLHPKTTVDIFEDGTSDYFDNAKIISVDKNNVTVSIARVLLQTQFKTQD